MTTTQRKQRKQKSLKQSAITARSAEHTDQRGAAQYLTIHHCTLCKLDSRGEGPRRSRIGRRVVYTFKDLDEWLGARREERV